MRKGPYLPKRGGRILIGAGWRTSHGIGNINMLQYMIRSATWRARCVMLMPMDQRVAVSVHRTLLAGALALQSVCYTPTHYNFFSHDPRDATL